MTQPASMIVAARNRRLGVIGLLAGVSALALAVPQAAMAQDAGPGSVPATCVTNGSNARLA
ncbi:MAG: hypothetical protein ACK4Y4_09810, partial [Brevundimonas sp.]